MAMLFIKDIAIYLVFKNICKDIYNTADNWN